MGFEFFIPYFRRNTACIGVFRWWQIEWHKGYKIPHTLVYLIFSLGGFISKGRLVLSGGIGGKENHQWVMSMSLSW